MSQIRVALGENHPDTILPPTQRQFTARKVNQASSCKERRVGVQPMGYEIETKLEVDACKRNQD